MPTILQQNCVSQTTSRWNHLGEAAWALKCRLGLHTLEISMAYRTITHQRLWWQHWRASFCLFVLFYVRVVPNEYEGGEKARPAWYLWYLIEGSDIQLADWQVRNVTLFIGFTMHEANFLHVIIGLAGIGISDKLLTATLVSILLRILRKWSYLKELPVLGFQWFNITQVHLYA